MDSIRAARLSSAAHWRAVFVAPWMRWVGLLALCAPYLQGGINKATDFDGAIAEMNHFGLSPAAPLALATIVVELGASAMILAGFYRWLGALALAGFTLFAAFVANRFWEMARPKDSWPQIPSSSTSD